MDKENDFYKREKENISGKERFSTLKGKEKWNYFKTYYLLKMLLGVAIFSAFIAIIVSRIKAQNDVSIYVAVVSDVLQEDIVLHAEQEFPRYLDLEGLDVSIFIDYSYITDEALLNMKVGLGSVDAIIAKKPVHDGYQKGHYVDLKEVLSKETLEKAEPYLYWQENEEGVNYANMIDLSACERYQMFEPSSKQVMIGIPSNSYNIEIAARFIDYLWEEKEETYNETIGN